MSGDASREDGEIVTLRRRVAELEARAEEHERTLEALKRSEETSRVLLNTLDFTAILISIDGTILAVSDATCERLGVSKEDLIGASAGAIQPREVADTVQEKAREAIATRASVSFRHGTGGKHYATSVHPIMAADDRVERLAIYTRDITEALDTERALRAGEERFRNLVEKQGEGIGIVDPDERFLFANPAAHRIMGVEPGGLEGHSLEEFMDDESFHAIEQQTMRRQRGEESVYQTDIVRPDGERRRIEVSATPQRDEDGHVTGTFGVFRDVTEIEQARQERERLEAQLRHSQKMETAGRLAGGVAHDFNNLLTVVQGSSEIMLARMRHDDPLLPLVQEILEASEKASALTRQLLAFSRKQVLEPTTLEPYEVVQSMVKMISRLIGENIQVSVRSDDVVRHARADRGQLEQVIVNMAVNARDAMPDGGRLVISVDGAPSTTIQEEDEELSGRDWIRVSIADTGDGMDPETRERIFEPFFTTKGLGRGTGLGLSMAYGIVTQSGGVLRVESEPGRGTRFDIYLPEVVPEEQPGAHPEGRRSEPPGGATVLVIEDDPSVRKLARMILVSRGYTVIEAGRGSEAEEVLEDHGGPVSLALVDVVLPGRSGPDVVAGLRERRPHMAVLYMSGYTDDAIGQHGVLEEGVNLIEKPFSTHELLRRVRALL